MDLTQQAASRAVRPPGGDKSRGLRKAKLVAGMTARLPKDTSRQCRRTFYRAKRSEMSFACAGDCNLRGGLAFLRVSQAALTPEEGSEMTIPEAKQYVGKNCWVSWTDRLGQEHNKVLQVEDLQFVPLYGAYIIGDTEEVRLEKVTTIRALD